MHPFPPREELLFLLKGEPRLTQLLINPYDVHLLLDNECSITAEQRIVHRTGGGVEIGWEPPTRDAPPLKLHQLIERRLTDVRVEPWAITLVFDGGDQVSVHSQDGPYESGNISDGPRQILF